MLPLLAGTDPGKEDFPLLHGLIASPAVTHEQRASLIKNLVMLVILGGAIAAGLFVNFPSSLPEGEKPPPPEELVTEERFQEVISAENQLTVMNMMVDGNPNSEKLQEIIEKLEKDKTYGEQVAYTELDVEKEFNIESAKAIDLEQFAGQLDFYAAGQKLGSLRGKTDPAVIEEEIQRYLRGLIKRFGPGWLPDVEGMSRADANSKVLDVEPADKETSPLAKPAPTKKPAPSEPASPGGVPSGMQRR